MIVLFCLQIGSTIESPTDEAPPRERLVGSVKDLDRERMFKGAVIYYAAEMEAQARQDVKDFATQVVSFQDLGFACKSDLNSLKE